MTQNGWLKIIGIGPGDEALITPQVTHAIAEATDAIGYIPYIERVAQNANLTLHPSDNRVEIERAQHALELAASGRRVIVVSSGDPSVFAMSAAVYEAVENGDPNWRDLQIEALPGITAMLAASAAAGAPLGHDFCAINLSDNLKPWSIIERRLRHAARGDFAMAFYNPRSKSRPEGFAKTLEILNQECADRRPILFCRNVSRPDQTITCLPLNEATPDMADMRTLVIVGTSHTRIISRQGVPIIYTPRYYNED